MPFPPPRSSTHAPGIGSPDSPCTRQAPSPPPLPEPLCPRQTWNPKIQGTIQRSRLPFSSASPQPASGVPTLETGHLTLKPSSLLKQTHKSAAHSSVPAQCLLGFFLPATGTFLRQTFVVTGSAMLGATVLRMACLVRSPEMFRYSPHGYTIHHVQAGH